MSHSTAKATGVRFGRTVMRAVPGDPAEQHVDVLICPANKRGVMGMGVAGSIRLAGGAEVERELMEHAPLVTGTAIATRSGSLEAMGISHIIHLVVSNDLGRSPKADLIRLATVQGMTLLDTLRARTVAFPLLGNQSASLGMFEEIIAHVRRFPGKLERVDILARDDAEVEFIQTALDHARQLWLEMRT